MPDELSTDEIAKLVDAAAEILADSGAKLPCRELVRIAVNTGMWNKPGTPATALLTPPPSFTVRWSGTGPVPSERKSPLIWKPGGPRRASPPG